MPSIRAHGCFDDGASTTRRLALKPLVLEAAVGSGQFHELMQGRFSRGSQKRPPQMCDEPGLHRPRDTVGEQNVCASSLPPPSAFRRLDFEDHECAPY
jgi:hypothetical protein